MEITFRDYTDSDKKSLLDLIKKLQDYQKLIDPIKRVQNLPGFAESTEEEDLKNITKYPGKILFAINNGENIGFISGVIWNQSATNKLEIGPHKIGEILNLFIEEKYRGKGIGKKLLQKMQDFFKDNGCDSIWLSVFVPNAKAKAIYESFGFLGRELGMLKEI